MPLIVLAVGAVLSRLARPAAHDRPARRFWAGAIFPGEHNHVLHEMHEVPLLVKLAPLFAMACRARPLLLHVIRGPAWRRGSRQVGGRSTASCYNKWYFDELYDFLFVRPAKAIG